VASSINIIVQVSRTIGGKRKITKISEVTGMETETVMMHDIFEYVQTGVDENHCAVGHFRATGIRPDCLSKLVSAGVEVPYEIFQPKQLKLWSKPS
jgi:pilus assembly protein CpaF